MTENYDYLEQIATRANLHVQTLEKTKDYLVEKRITDKNLIRDALIIGQVWASDTAGKPLTHNDLMMYLGNDDGPTLDYNEIVLDEEHKGKTLNELLELVVKRKLK